MVRFPNGPTAEKTKARFVFPQAIPRILRCYVIGASRFFFFKLNIEISPTCSDDGVLLSGSLRTTEPKHFWLGRTSEPFEPKPLRTSGSM